ncbi:MULTISPECIES: DUF1499 domain-containing protein [Gammaproteobacteria]|uniref:DUF1499 domain-containing protein n=1 Tax=Gammaproteobacteria TaxID=1236 RepID=UPI001AD9E046|nr:MULTISPECIES: DUF1499 domain-containing protein [Gammaproteobacteria]MBO9483267.1 DUF1499 domain-containing protein [Salinisphaera sp. G21_0]MBO9496147.1 DUF1499 domain-containing protein [Thalassotalea sp. G20_0]
MNKSAHYILPLLLLFSSHWLHADVPELTCPESPNCVSSLASGKQNIAPLSFDQSDTQGIKKKLLATLQNWPNAEILSSNDQIIITVFTTPWLKFKDDLILIIRPNGTVDVRSSSRVGYYDFGTNRRRIEKLRAALGDKTSADAESK